jgi:ubiquinol-cytochrome c reductase iron-sulfur subunit
MWILKRTKDMMEDIDQQFNHLKDPNALEAQQPREMNNHYRSLDKQFFVVLGKCTHMGCIPIMKLNEGIICPCHGSKFDFAGRVLKGSPASKNLVVPQYHFSPDGKTLIIGEA